MICEHCKQRQATVTVTQIINGHKSEKHYCEVCAAQFHPFNLDFHKEDSLPISSLLSNWFGLPIWKTDSQEKSVQPSSQVAYCPSCGFTFRKFLNEGKLGCSECYETFSHQLPQVLTKIQAGTKHTGRKPGQPVDNHYLIKKQMKQAREQLQLAIQDERFEDAARLRDEIKDLERKLDAGGVDTP